MEGGQTPQTYGLVPRCVKMMFETLKKYEKDQWKQILVTISCFEIHIETVRDLLDPKNESAQIMTNQKFKATELEVRDFEDVDFILRKARENRRVASTAMNAYSSRSHSIYQLKIKAIRDDNF